MIHFKKPDTGKYAELQEHMMKEKQNKNWDLYPNEAKEITEFNPNTLTPYEEIEESYINMQLDSPFSDGEVRPVAYHSLSDARLTANQKRVQTLLDLEDSERDWLDMEIDTRLDMQKYMH